MLAVKRPDLPATGADPPLTFRATVTKHLKRGKLVAVAAAAKKAKTTTKIVTIAAGSLSSLSAGSARTITLKLNSTALKLLIRYHSLRITMMVSENGKTLAKRTVRVHPPQKKKPKK